MVAPLFKMRIIFEIVKQRIETKKYCEDTTSGLPNKCLEQRRNKHAVIEKDKKIDRQIEKERRAQIELPKLSCAEDD
jgi:hypothetical protein